MSADPVVKLDSAQDRNKAALATSCLAARGCGYDPHGLVGTCCRFRQANSIHDQWIRD